MACYEKRIQESQLPGSDRDLPDSCSYHGSRSCDPEAEHNGNVLISLYRNGSYCSHTGHEPGGYPGERAHRIQKMRSGCNDHDLSRNDRRKLDDLRRYSIHHLLRT